MEAGSGVRGVLMEPLACAHGFDFLGGDNGSAATVGVHARPAAIVRPLEGHNVGQGELLEQVLEERADRVDAPVAGMQPQALLPVEHVAFDFKAPVFRAGLKLGRETRFGFIALIEATGLSGDFEGVGQRGIIGQRDQEAEVGEVIGHGWLLGLRVEG